MSSSVIWSSGSYSCVVPVVPRLRFRSRLRCRLRRRPPRASSSSSAFCAADGEAAARAARTRRRLAALPVRLAVLLRSAWRSAWRSCCRSAWRSCWGLLLGALGAFRPRRCRVGGGGRSVVWVASWGCVRSGRGALGASPESDRAPLGAGRPAVGRRSAGVSAGSGRPLGLGLALRLGRRLGTRSAADLARGDRRDEVVLAHLRRPGDAEARSEAFELDDVHRRQAGAAGGGHPFGGVCHEGPSPSSSVRPSWAAPVSVGESDRLV